MARIRSAITHSAGIDQAAIAEAVSQLAAGEVVGLPTETVYGLAANALNESAVQRIFAAKGRPSINPLIVHVLGEAQARQLASAWPETARKLAAAFWPGPLTIVLPKTASVPDAVTAGLPAVALRAPAHPVFRAVLEQSGMPLAAPSANRSNAISPTTAEHVQSSLGDRIDLILDGGPCSFGLESTVVDLTGERPVILRPGGISAEHVASVVGPLADAAPVAHGAARVSPGQMLRHYAPQASVLIVSAEDVVASLAQLPENARVVGLTPGSPRPTDSRIIRWELLGTTPAEYARQLYAALHRADEAAATHILVERVSNTPEWEAVRDRLRRASTRE